MAKPRQSPQKKKAASDASGDAADDDERRRAEEKEARERALRERVRERLKARQAAAAGEPAAKRARDDDDADADVDAKRPRRDTHPEPVPSRPDDRRAPSPDDPSRAGAFDAATEERRRRVEEWRARRREVKETMEEADEATLAATAAKTADAPEWRIDEDEDNDEDDALAPAPGAAEEDDDALDPLEAFMAANDTVMDAERAEAKRKTEEREEATRRKKEEKDREAARASAAADFAAAAAAAAARAAAKAAAAKSGEEAEESKKEEEEEEPGAHLPPLRKEPEEEIDPLDAFMAENTAKAEAMLVTSAKPKRADAPKTKAAPAVAGGMLLKKPQSSGFLNGLVLRKTAGGAIKPKATTKPNAPPAKKIGIVKRFFDADSDADSSSDDAGDASSASDDDEEWARKQNQRLSKAEKLGVTDHDAVEYAPFRKNFYIESYEIARMTSEEVKELRGELEGIRCRGKDVPRPIKTWAQAGLSNRVMELIRRSGFEKPMPIQCQALPVIMSGRDCIGVAKTGSGKTLSYVLPMLRHIKDQPAIEPGDGPIGMIVGPTRELVTQIGKDCKKFGRAAGLVAVSVYGGSSVGSQIGDLKRGCEIVACTPGRMIDILTTGGGRITNLRRVTYMVLDEADRMFDMGFEPQITRIMNNLRPDRQTVMFSATFPRAMEALARATLKNPVEIQVGGRSVVNSDIEQIVEMREEGDRFLRLLELLGEWYERGKVIVFVHSQDKCDQVFRDLLRSGYPCLSLHGGKEQSDRECTIADFKSDVCNILIATSVAARGLDVKDLRLVVNYDTPNHLEDYVHRVGRTGRAGNKGTAVTFISRDEEKFAPDLVKAMTEAKQPVPADLKRMAEEHAEKRIEGLAKGGGGGFGGSGFTFSREEQEAERNAKRAAARAAGLEIEEEDADAADEDEAGLWDDDGEPVFQSTGRSGQAAANAAAALEAEAALRAARETTAAKGAAAAAAADPLAAARLAAARVAAAAAAANPNATPIAAASIAAAAAPTTLAAAAAAPRTALAVSDAAAGALALGGANSGAARAAAFAAALNAKHAAGAARAAKMEAHFESELEINDFPQQARWKVTHKDSLAQIAEFTGTAITTRGQFYAPGKQAPPGERRLYLLIEGPTERCVKEAKNKIKEIIEQVVAKEALPGGFQAKYKV